MTAFCRCNLSFFKLLPPPSFPSTPLVSVADGDVDDGVDDDGVDDDCDGDCDDGSGDDDNEVMVMR